MSSRFQATVLVSSPSYPNAVVWSEENLVAVASGNIVTILNPAKASGTGSRGVITVHSSKPFPIGVIDGGGTDLLSGCFLPIHLSRDTRPCVRSISWSPVGLANNAGCLLAVCTTEGRVKLYRLPFCEVSTEWIEVMDMSEMMYTYLLSINFGESKTVSSESVDVISDQVKTDNECPIDLPVSSLRKERKRRRQNSINVAAKEPNNVTEINTLQIVSVSASEGKPPKKVIEDCNVSLITVSQYASRNAMLTPLVVAWSPILRTSGYGVALPHNSSTCCSILAVGWKCGRISFWRIHAPECYSIVNEGHLGKTSLVGLLKPHDTWITTINWALCSLDVSKPQLLLATGSSDGRVKIWLVNGEEMLKSLKVFHSSFSLLVEIVPADSSPISVLSLTVPVKTPSKLLLAIGKGSGSFEVRTLDMLTSKVELVGCYNAHDHIVTGLAWAFDGHCLYSCSQDNSVKSWILIGNSMCEVQIPSKIPGLKSSLDVPRVFDSCFGLAVSPGNLVIAMARRFDSDLLNPMYQERTQKAAVEFFWIGGQQLDISSNICPDIDNEPFPGFPKNEQIWWERNILWSLNQFENLNKLPNIWDIVAALLSFKQSIPKFVDKILFKWLASYFGSQFGNSTTFLSKASKSVPNLSSRQLHLINIISRCVVLKKSEAGKMISKCKELQGLSDTGVTEERENLWMELHLSSEIELWERLVGFNFSVILNVLSNSSTDFCEVGRWSPDGWPQMKQWVSLNEKNVKDHFKFLASEIGKVEKSRLHEIFGSELDERCSFCSASVSFESTEYAICSGGKCYNGADQSHKLERCAVSMRVCPPKSSWFCMCCRRQASKLAPGILFIMPGYPSDFESFLESSAYRDSLTPCCPFCGILLQRLQPEYFLSPSPV